VTNHLELDQDFDPDTRQLCSDGNCTGLIGEDGECKVCGGTTASHDLNVTAPEVAEINPDSDFDDRHLCPDGNCTGLLDEQGHCKVCGKSS
jgi:hypothetical protein